MIKKFFLYFGFNQIEQRGFLVFTALILVVIFTPYLLKSIKNSNDISYELVYFEPEKREFERPSTDYSNAYNSYKKESFSNNKRTAVTYFDFDPNNLDEASWAKLGFTDKQIRVIKNYEAKGGRFYKKEDVEKIYVISSVDYKRIEPYIKIENKKAARVYESKAEEAKASKGNIVTKVVDINTADTSSWKNLNGIGSVLSKRIVKYRDALGGFNSIDQVAEVYGLPAETYEKIKEYLKIENAKGIRRLNINLVTVDELAKHPYISKKQAQTIVNYRDQHGGSFANLETLSKINSLDREFLRKIEPYLEF